MLRQLSPIGAPFGEPRWCLERTLALFGVPLLCLFITFGAQSGARVPEQSSFISTLAPTFYEQGAHPLDCSGSPGRQSSSGFVRPFLLAAHLKLSSVVDEVVSFPLSKIGINRLNINKSTTESL